MTDETDTAIPLSTSSDEESQTERSTADHPLIDPVAFTIDDQTSVSRQQARETTARLLSELEDPTYPPVLKAVADELGVEIFLEEILSETSVRNGQNDSTYPVSTRDSSRPDDVSKGAYWKS